MKDNPSGAAWFLPPDPDLALESLLPLKVAVVTMEFLSIAQPQFFHQAPLTAFLRHWLDSPWDYAINTRVDAVESRRIS